MPSRSLKLSPDLDEAIERRYRALGYSSLSAYLKGLVRYDLLCQGPHTMTQPWASLPLADQDKIDAKLLVYSRQGVGERGQLLRRIIEGAQDVLGENHEG
jgi:hypothetical protein